MPSWVWTLAFGAFAAGAYWFWTDGIGPWFDQLSNAGFGGTDVFSMIVFSGAFWEGWSDMIDAIQIGALILVAIVAIGWIRRRLRRSVAIAVVMSALLFAAGAAAAGRGGGSAARAIHLRSRGRNGSQRPDRHGRFREDRRHGRRRRDRVHARPHRDRARHGRCDCVYPGSADRRNRGRKCARVFARRDPARDGRQERHGVRELGRPDLQGKRGRRNDRARGRSGPGRQDPARPAGTGWQNRSRWLDRRPGVDTRRDPDGGLHRGNSRAGDVRGPRTTRCGGGSQAGEPHSNGNHAGDSAEQAVGGARRRSAPFSVTQRLWWLEFCFWSSSPDFSGRHCARRAALVSPSGSARWR